MVLCAFIFGNRYFTWNSRPPIGDACQYDRVNLMHSHDEYLDACKVRNWGLTSGAIRLKFLCCFGLPMRHVDNKLNDAKR
jgi:hypothetical protein